MDPLKLFFLYWGCNELRNCSTVLQIGIQFFRKFVSKLSVKNRLSFSILDMVKCRSLKCRVILANSSMVSKEKLHSFNWSLLEISVMERVSVLSQKATHRHRCKKARALFLVIWWIALFKHLSPLNYVKHSYYFYVTIIILNITSDVFPWVLLKSSLWGRIIAARSYPSQNFFGKNCFENFAKYLCCSLFLIKLQICEN